MTAFATLLADYRRYGAAFPIRVLSPEVAAGYRAHCDELERLLGGAPKTVEVRQMHLHFRWAYELCVSPLVLDAVESVLGPDLLIWATELFAKRARDPNLFIAWHRDRTYMGFDPATTVTAWIALAPSHPENGCLQVVPDERRQVRRTKDAKGPEPGDRVIPVVLAPGEMSLHDADIHHGSGPNLSGVKRVGFAVRFITPEARPLSGRPRVIVARGRSSDAHFEIAEPPTESDPETALLGLRESARRHLDAMLENLKERRP